MSQKVESKLDRELHHAAATGSSKLAQKILDSGKVHVDCQDEEGITPLMLATANNRHNCVKILLQEGAEPHLKAKDGSSAIFLAARCGYASLLSMLLESLPSPSKVHLSGLARKDGITPLIMAAAMNHDHCVDLLLSAGMDPNEESKIGSTPLFHACLRGQVKAARRLICDPRINLGVLRHGETCLHAAAISGNPELVQLLLDSGSGINPALTNAGGQTPLDLLIMFINYGNIALTPNLLKVLNLLPSDITEDPKIVHQKKVVGLASVPQGELENLRKLVRIYCPFNYNHSKALGTAKGVNGTLENGHQESCNGKNNRAFFQEFIACSSVKVSRSLNNSPNKNGKNHHVRFSPETVIKDDDHEDVIQQGVGILRAHCRLLTTQELMQTWKKSPKRVFFSKLKNEDECLN